MNHLYIDQHSIAERYLANALSPADRDAFERHLVDCQECTDRVLLASMFHAHSTNGNRASAPARPALAVRLRPITILWIVLVSVLLLLGIPWVAWLLVRRSMR